MDVALGGALEPDLFARAMSDRKKTPASLEKKIGHRFKDKSLLTQALTHVSAIGDGKLKTIAQIFKEQGGFELLGTVTGAEMIGWDLLALGLLGIDAHDGPRRRQAPDRTRPAPDRGD